MDDVCMYVRADRIYKISARAAYWRPSKKGTPPTYCHPCLPPSGVSTIPTAIVMAASPHHIQWKMMMTMMTTTGGNGRRGGRGTDGQEAVAEVVVMQGGLQTRQGQGPKGDGRPVAAGLGGDDHHHPPTPLLFPLVPKTPLSLTTALVPALVLVGVAVGVAVRRILTTVGDGRPSSRGTGLLSPWPLRLLVFST